MGLSTSEGESSAASEMRGIATSPHQEPVHKRHSKQHQREEKTRARKNRSDIVDRLYPTSPKNKRLELSRRTSPSRSPAASTSAACSSREPPPKTFLVELMNHFRNWVYWSLEPIMGTLRHVLCLTMSLVLFFAVVLFSTAVYAPLLMDAAVAVPQLALDQLCDNGLRYVTTSRTARILHFPDLCPIEHRATGEVLPSDPTGVRAVARWGNTESDLLQPRDNFASLSRELSKQASLIRVQQEGYVDGAKLYALTKDHQQQHEKAEDLVSNLYRNHRIFQRNIIQDIQDVHESLNERTKHYGHGSFGWHTVVEGLARWIPDVFSLTLYATVLESLATFAEDHQPEAEKLNVLSHEVQQTLIRAREARDEVSAQFASEYRQWESRCVVTETPWLGLRTVTTTSTTGSYCQVRDVGNLKQVLEDESEWLGKVAQFAEAQKVGYSGLTDHYNNVSERLRRLIGKSRQRAVGDMLQHSAKLVNGVQEDMFAAKQTIEGRLNQPMGQPERTHIEQR